MKNHYRSTRRLIAFSFASLLLSATSFALDPKLESDANAEEPQKESLSTRLNEIVVSSQPLPQTLFEHAQPVSVLTGSELQTRAKGSLGETLAAEPGISSTSFGPGASRPVIRGLGGDRIRILENGIGSQDVSNTSPDHAVTIDPLLSESIEVVRGPATLMYGTSAVGGVVNIIDNRIPEIIPASPAEGKIAVQGGTVDNLRNGAMTIDAPVGPFAVHLDAFTRKSDDIEIPGFARTEALRESGDELEFPEPKGKLPFSASASQGVGVGTSYIWDTGFLGVAGSLFNFDYGVPNGEKNITIDGQRPRFDVHGRILDPISFVKSMDLKLGYVDYKHTEFEDGEAGTVFTNKGFDGRYEITHQSFGPVDGVLGFQAQSSQFKADGEEAFQPPTDTDIFSAFLFEEVKLADPLKLQFGVRFDNNDLKASDREDLDSGIISDISRSTNTVSESIGLVWTPVDNYAFALSLAHTERAPSGQELFANGPHIATNAFEIGDPDLDTEKSIGLDLNIRKRSGRVTGFIGGFINRFDNYIGLNATGEEEDGLPIFRFVSQDADFLGFESQVALHFLGETEEEQNEEDLSFWIQPDYVRAKDRDTNDPLPRVPPFRLRTGVDYKKGGFKSRIELQHVFEQDRISDLETETGAYTFLNASVSKEVTVRGQMLEFFLRGENLTDEEGRNHVSFIKDIAPLPGRNVIAGLQLRF